MRPITDVLREARGGRVADLASRRLAELVQAVDDTNKVGEITIKIKVKPEKGGGSQKQLVFDVKSKLPEHDLPEATFFSDANGDLHRSDPAQSEMFKDTAAIRPVGSA